MRSMDLRGRLGPLRVWLLPAAAVLVVLALVALAGGFRGVEGAQGRRVPADAVVELARWSLVVHDVELVPGSPDDPSVPPEVLVHLRATFTGERSTYGIPQHLITVRAPDGPLGIEDFPAVDGPRQGGFDPDVPQEVSVGFTWSSAPATAPPVLRVILRDERESENYLYSAPQWGVAPTPVAHLDLPCPDRR
jgi:hypothetical protein